MSTKKVRLLKTAVIVLIILINCAGVKYSSAPLDKAFYISESSVVQAFHDDTPIAGEPAKDNSVSVSNQSQALFPELVNEYECEIDGLNLPYTAEPLAPISRRTKRGF